LQGYSVAAWEQPYRLNASAFQRGAVPGRGEGLGQMQINVAQPGGELAVVTSDLAPGWLRRNGVTHGSHTRLIEHYQTFQDPTGKQWFDVTTEVIDSEYLNTPFLTSADFQKDRTARSGLRMLVSRLRGEIHADQATSSEVGGRFDQRCRIFWPLCRRLRSR
jgi:hypothetical protein